MLQCEFNEHKLHYEDIIQLNSFYNDNLKKKTFSKKSLIGHDNIKDVEVLKYLQWPKLKKKQNKKTDMIAVANKVVHGKI